MNAPRHFLRKPAAAFSRRLLLAAGLCAVLAALLVIPAQIGFGFVQPEKKDAAGGSPGLRGILPAEVPDDLAFEAFEALGKDWAKWSESVNGNLNKLYSGEKVDAAAQRKIIADVREQLKVVDRSVVGARRTHGLDVLVDLAARIRRRLDIAAAILDTVEADPRAYRERASADAWKNLTSTLTAVDSYLRGFSNGAAWRKYVRLEQIGEAVRNKNASAPELAAVAKKIGNRKNLAQDQQQFLSSGPFTQLKNALQAVTAAAAIPEKVDAKALRAELKNLAAALERYEATNGATAASSARTAFDRIPRLAGDGGQALGDAMRTHYFNYNFRVYVSESFINKAIAERRVERQGINEMALGAHVYGSQVTSAATSVDLQPSRRDARMNIRVAGTTQSSTVGMTDQANVWVSGTHGFWINRELRFDGERFTAPGTAWISISANNQVTGAKTKYSGIPLFGSIADSIAMSRARDRMPQSNALVRQKIAAQALPRFNQEVTQKLADANRDIQTKLNKRIEEAGVKPETYSIRTTDNMLLYSSRVMKPSEFAGSSTNSIDPPGWGLTLKVHESAMNNAFDRLNIAGRTMTREELTDEIEKSISDMLGRKPVPPAPGKAPKPKDDDKFVFDSKDPIRFRVRNGSLFITIRAGLRPVGREPIPTQVVTVPLDISVVGNQVEVKRGTVVVAPAEKPENAATQIVRAGIMRKKIEDSMPNKMLKRTVSVKAGVGEKPLVLTITRISAVNGWMTMWAQ
jgi:hypothetical protein